MQLRRTVVVHGRLAAHEARLAAARERAHGTQILTTEQMVSRLAGGFLQGIDREALQEAVRAALDEELGEIDAIKHLPGMVRAAIGTLEKVWRAGINLEAHSSEHPRFDALHRLERAVLQRLPPSMLRPTALAEQAAARLAHAPQVLGPVTVRGITEMAPCWRPLLFALAEVVPVVWEAGPRETPAWLEGQNIEIRRSETTAAGTEAVSCANARHEALEALRWARELMASGRARPEEIAIAAKGGPKGGRSLHRVL